MTMLSRAPEVGERVRRKSDGIIGEIQFIVAGQFVECRPQKEYELMVLNDVMVRLEVKDERVVTHGGDDGLKFWDEWEPYGQIVWEGKIESCTMRVLTPLRIEMRWWFAGTSGWSSVDRTSKLYSLTLEALLLQRLPEFQITK